MKKPLFRNKRIDAFTLVEVLVAEAIFLILLFVVVQLIFGVVQSVSSQKKRMDTLGDARQSLDRLSLDWAGRVRRSDVNAVLAHQVAGPANAANAQISFLAQVPAYSGARHLSWVSYGVTNITQVNKGGQSVTTPALVRGILGYNWSSSDATGTANPLLEFPTTTPDMTTANAAIEPLANTVFRFDYCFLQQTPAVTGATTTSAFTTNSALNLSSSSVIGIVVAVASLDQQSRQLVDQTQLVNLGNALATVPDGQDPQSFWLASINSGTFTVAGVPPTVYNSIRVFQRVLYIKE